MCASVAPFRPAPQGAQIDSGRAVSRPPPTDVSPLGGGGQYQFVGMRFWTRVRAAIGTSRLAASLLSHSGKDVGEGVAFGSEVDAIAIC